MLNIVQPVKPVKSPNLQSAQQQCMLVNEVHKVLPVSIYMYKADYDSRLSLHVHVCAGFTESQEKHVMCKQWSGVHRQHNGQEAHCRKVMVT